MKRFLIIFIILTFSKLYSQVEVSELLSDSLQYAFQENVKIKAMVVLKDQVDIISLDKQLYRDKATISERTYTVINALQNKANSTQGPILEYLQLQSKSDVAIIEKYWIINALMIKANPQVIMEISARDDIALMDIEHKPVADPVFDENLSPERTPGAAEPGLRVVNAHKLWEMGYTGTGRLVMNYDSGVDGTHPALSSRWRGNHVPYYQAWKGIGTIPTDDDGHGTHTMGTITGYENATLDTVGIAINAEWIAADMDVTNMTTVFQWAMNPDGNASTTDDMPDVISNSWGYLNSTGACWSQYASILNSVEAVGIAVVFSGGNEGPGPQTTTAPKNINTNLVNSFSIGNINGHNSSFPIASSSSRGPSGCGGTGSLLIKPETVAPGTNVRSAWTGGGYNTISGTSMSCPHVAGVIALLKEAFPNKTGHEIKLAIYHSARETLADLATNDPGEEAGETSGEDNNYGNGLVDAYAAYEYLLGKPGANSDLTAYSDYSTPTSIELNWTNPTTLLNGTPLSSSYYHTMIERNDILIDSVAGGTSTYTDVGLTDGTEYFYSIFVKVDSNNMVSENVEASWIAGGSPIPNTAQINSISGGPDSVKLKWINPSQNVDGTPLDDLQEINLYQDSVLATTFTRTTTDTGRLDSALYNPGTVGIYHWHITVVDNEPANNESEQSNVVRSPLNVNIVDSFSKTGRPNSDYWETSDAVVDDRADNPPSGPYALNINSTPNAGDIIELYPADMTGEHGNGVVFAYQYQPQGTSTDPPEVGDSLRVLFRKSDGTWKLIKSYPGSNVYPFRSEVVDLDSLAGIGDNYFYNGFRIRFSSIGNAHPLWPRDDWFVDNVFFGTPAPFISVDTDSILFDSLEIGLTDTIYLEVQNIGLQDLAVLDILNSNNVFSIDVTNFTVAAGSNQKVMIVFSSQSSGTFSTNLKIVHDVPNTDTVSVYVSGNVYNPASITKDDQLPQQFSLSQNYPNPFNPETNIEFAMPKSGFVTLKVYNVLGQEVATIAEQNFKAGVHSFIWDAADFASGIYYYRIAIHSDNTTNENTELFAQTRKLVVLK